MPVPLLLSILGSPLPQVRLVNEGLDTTALTTYTFTAAAVGLRAGAGFHPLENAVSDTPLVASPSRKAIYVIVHARDALVTFGVNSVTIGGVSGTELVDRGGATQVINTAIYGWSDSALAAITAWDVVVTMSEPVTQCGYELVEISNVRSFGAIAAGSGVSTASVNIDVTGVTDAERLPGGGVILAGMTVLGNQTDPSWQIDGTATGVVLDAFLPTVLLPVHSDTNITFSSAYYLIPSVNCHDDDTIQNIRVVSTGGLDMAAIYVA